jgi:hypothetical protein
MLAIPPTLFCPVVEQLGKSGCSKGARAIIEKPLGTNLVSTRATEMPGRLLLVLVEISTRDAISTALVSKACPDFFTSSSLRRLGFDLNGI